MIGGSYPKTGGLVSVFSNQLRIKERRQKGLRSVKRQTQCQKPSPMVLLFVPPCTCLDLQNVIVVNVGRSLKTHDESMWGSIRTAGWRLNMRENNIFPQVPWNIHQPPSRRNGSLSKKMDMAHPKLSGWKSNIGVPTFSFKSAWCVRSDRSWSTTLTPTPHLFSDRPKDAPLQQKGRWPDKPQRQQDEKEHLSRDHLPCHLADFHGNCLFDKDKN